MSAGEWIALATLLLTVLIAIVNFLAWIAWKAANYTISQLAAKFTALEQKYQELDDKYDELKADDRDLKARQDRLHVRQVRVEDHTGLGPIQFEA